MRNPHGFPIWYELQTVDPAGASAFYDQVFGWTVGPKPDGGPMDYRMIDTGHGSVGGLAVLDDRMVAGGAKPGWLFYVGVDDVDATAAAAIANGGQVLIPPSDIPDVGRFAMLADPQGVRFYVMRGIPDEASTAYERMAMGKCSWNELMTTDQDGANAFYAALFGWAYPDSMPMGELGDYVFIETAGQVIGATMRKSNESRAAWQFYFRLPDIDAGVERITAAGGTVLFGPMEVPGGEKVVVAIDPQGVAFGAVAPGEGGAA